MFEARWHKSMTRDSPPVAKVILKLIFRENHKTGFDQSNEEAVICRDYE